MKILSQEEFNTQDIGKKLEYLCQFGLLAPTSHNTVPERFKLMPRDNSIEVYLDRELILPASDKTGRQACISLGTVCSNILIAAKVYGLEGKITYYDPDPTIITPWDQKEPRLIFLVKIKVNSHQSIHKSQDSLKNIIDRKVVRGEYDESIKLEEKLTEDIKLYVQSNYPNLTLHLIEDPQSLHFLGKIQEMADTTVFNDPAFSKELGDWLLPNTDTTTHSGMRGAEFGLNDQMAARMHNGLSGKIPLLPDEIAAFAAGGRFLIKHSSAVAVITAKEDTATQRIQAGQAYEDLALKLLNKTFSTSVHAGTIEVNSANLMLRSFLKTTDRPMMLFRIGKPKRKEDANRPLSLKPNLEELLINQ